MNTDNDNVVEPKKENRAKVVFENLMTVVFAFASMGILAMLALKLTYLGPVAQTMKDFSLTDVYYYALKENGSPDTSRVVTIVDMTDLPDRAAIADGLERIMAMNPKVVGVDVVFEGNKPDTLADQWLTQLARDTSIVFSYRVEDYVDDTVGYGNEVHSFFSEEVQPNEGFTNFERRLVGGLKRNLTLSLRCQGTDRKSLVEQVAEHYAGTAIPHRDAKKLNVNYRPTAFRMISPDSIEYHRDWIEDHIVLYGATHELADIHYTPVGEMAGIELLAYSIQTLLEQSEVKHISGWMTAILSFFIVLITHLGRKAYLKWAKARKSPWMKFFFTTTFVVGLLMSLWTIMLVWIGFLVFYLTGYSLNWGWAMAAIPFLGGAREFYELMITHAVGNYRNKV